MSTAFDASARPITSKPHPGVFPAEIQIEIAKCCDDATLLNLRQVSRALSQNTFEIFAKRLFAVISCDGVDSVERLHTISTNLEFGQYVKTVQLRSKCFESLQDFYKNHYKPMDAVHHMLQAALDNLSRLGTDVQIEHLLGCNTPGHDGKYINNHLLFGSHCKPTSLRLGLCWLSTRLTAFPYARFGIRRLRSRWSNVTRLHIDFTQWQYISLWNRGLCDFLASAEGIQELELRGALNYHLRDLEAAVWFVRRKSAGAVSLRILKLLECRPEGLELLDFLAIQRHSLKELHLDDVSIVKGWQEWRAVLRWIARAMRLESFKSQALSRKTYVFGWLPFLTKSGEDHFRVIGTRADVESGLLDYADSAREPIQHPEWLY